MNAYSKYLRLKILAAVERGIPRREIADHFGVSRPTIGRCIKLKVSGRDLAPSLHWGANRRSLKAQITRSLCGNNSKRMTRPLSKNIARCSSASGEFRCPSLP
ncbi:MAG: helix-turn-helix domain-containing protein [Rubrobacter sp.]|nr:helix-turn-helix domain-containing protein [Rubrobacter sp.]